MSRYRYIVEITKDRRYPYVLIDTSRTPKNEWDHKSGVLIRGYADWEMAEAERRRLTNIMEDYKGGE